MSLSFSVPAHALSAWEQLHAAIARTGPTPCADESIRDLWTGTQAEQTIAADRCLGCAAMTACTTYADAAHEREGTWGGRTARQRNARQETA